MAAESEPLRAADAPGLDTYWPAGEHRTLLQIACSGERTARLAWTRWVEASGGREPDLGSLRLLPLVAERLRALRISSASAARLCGVYRHAWCTNQIMVNRALALMHAMNRRGVEVMALKGLALLPTAYGSDPGLRAMFDVDLLVHRADFASATAALTAEGWRSRFAGFIVAPNPGEAPLDCYALVFHKEKMEVDLHWHFWRLDPSPWVESEVWSRAQRETLCGREILVPSPSDLMLLVCVHGMGWTQAGALLWPADVWRLARRLNEDDWQRLVDLSLARLFTLPVYSALRFVREVLEGEIPDWVLRELGQTEVSPAEISELKTLTIPRYGANFNDSLVAGRLAHMRVTTRDSLRPRFFANQPAELSGTGKI